MDVSRGDLTATALAEVELDLAVDYVTWDGESDSVDAESVEEVGVHAFARVSAEAGESAPESWGAWVDVFEF